MLRYAPRNRFVSYFFVEIDAEAHTGALVQRRSRTVSDDRPRRRPNATAASPTVPRIGCAARPRFSRSWRTSCGHGDLLVVCSDGVTDAESPDTEPFGEERLDAILRSMVGKSPTEVRKTILEAVGEHVQGSPPSDDLTVVAVRRDPLGDEQA